MKANPGRAIVKSFFTHAMVTVALTAVAFSIGATPLPPAIQWQQSYGGAFDDEPAAIKPTSDGGYIIAGFTKTSSDYFARDGWVVKVDANGNQQWNKSFGGTNVDAFT